MADAFELLGISRGSSVDEIRKAYRQMARRWHPDRFAPGPERLWAEQKMIDINAAYTQALHTLSSPSRVSEPDDELKDARRLLDLGQLSAARQALMRGACRSAEWNYLFGAVLLRLGESQKALLYFGVASRQRPDNSCYRAAYRSAEAICHQKKGSGRLRKWFPWK